MIVINKKQIQTIGQQIIQTAIENAYKMMLKDNYTMPDRMHVAHKQNMLLLMPCFSKKYFATKLVSVFPKAPEMGEPSVNGVVILNDNHTGKPLAMMDGASLTAQRTGAVGGLAVKHLTDKNIKKAAVFGAGVQGFQQARYLLFNRRLKTLFINDLSRENAQLMAERLKSEFQGLECRICENADLVIAESQVILAATTSSKPLFQADPEMVKGKTFISIGSFQPDMQEFPNTISQTSNRIFADTLFAKKESGDLANPIQNGIIDEQKVESFAALLENPVSSGKTYFFKSVGMALFDLSAAIEIYQIAMEKQLGEKIEI